jgi:hypothetical protein
MTNMKLEDFIGVHRDDLIQRCRIKVTTRPTPPHTKAEIDHGVPLFLDSLLDELRQEGLSQTSAIRRNARRHGKDLLHQGFTVEQVVHDYGDICQAVTDLAVEIKAPISAHDFRTLNRCLDDAIAGAVSEFVSEQNGSRELAAYDLRSLADTALVALDAIQRGAVGVSGSTGAVLRRAIMDLRAGLASVLMVLAA